MLVDFDNIFGWLWKLDRQTAWTFATEPMVWLPLLAERHVIDDRRRWLVARCYLNPAGFVPSEDESSGRLYLSRFRPHWVRAGFEVVDCPAVARGGKNAADIRLVIDALDLLAHPTCFGEFVIASGDSDMTPLLHRIRAHDRRVTIMSPGFASTAYTSLADRIVDFAGIDALVSPAEPEPVEEAPPESVDEAEPLRRGFRDFITGRYAEATAPLNLASLSSHAQRDLPGVKESRWLGFGSFKDALAALDLPHVRFSQQFLWDAERHEPPTGVEGNQAGGLPDVIEMLARNLDLPRLPQEAWPEVFRMLAQYASEEPFTLTECTRWTRDRLAEQELPVSRAAVGYVVRGTQLGGAPLDADPPPEADDIANAFLKSLIERVAGMGMDIQVEDQLAGWLGLGEVVAGPG
ncbi:MAG: NYN domain-containing protein [Novosphingobium sp.]